MATDCIAQLTFRSDGFLKPVVAAFDVAHASSDGGALLLKALDDALGLTTRVAACLGDARQASKVQHSVLDLLRQRVYGLALGYPDGNDAARVAHDPLHKLLVERDPLTGAALGSQPTLSRFENAVTRAGLHALATALADLVIARHRRRLGRRTKRITIDLDTTEDPTHGQQEFAAFNGFYAHACYLPLIATLTFNAEPQQYLVAALLRPGIGAPSGTAIGLLRRLVPTLRAAFPRARLRVRLDAGFAGERLLAFLEDAQVEYLVALQGHSRLRRRARRLQGRARRLSRERGRPVRVFGQTHYRARRWRARRRVIMKAEVVWHPGRPPKNNPRFVVTNLSHRPRRAYQLYCGRGDVENRLKELHVGLALDRTSCSRFRANTFRVLLTAVAYVLFQELQRRVQRTACAGAQVWTLRERLLKVAAWVERSVRRIVVHLPTTYPWQPTWRQLAHAFGAT